MNRAIVTHLSPHDQHRYSLVLPQDPHLNTVLPTLVVAMVTMYRDTFSSTDKDQQDRLEM